MEEERRRRPSGHPWEAEGSSTRRAVQRQRARAWKTAGLLPAPLHRHLSPARGQRGLCFTEGAPRCGQSPVASLS